MSIGNIKSLLGSLATSVSSVSETIQKKAIEAIASANLNKNQATTVDTTNLSSLVDWSQASTKSLETKKTEVLSIFDELNKEGKFKALVEASNTRPEQSTTLYTEENKVTTPGCSSDKCYMKASTSQLAPSSDDASTATQIVSSDEEKTTTTEGTAGTAITYNLGSLNSKLLDGVLANLEYVYSGETAEDIVQNDPRKLLQDMGITSQFPLIKAVGLQKLASDMYKVAEEAISADAEI